MGMRLALNYVMCPKLWPKLVLNRVARKTYRFLENGGLAGRILIISKEFNFLGRAARRQIFEELESQKRKVYGLEMEAFGCYDAARRLGDLAPEVVCLKSVCDFGDGEKNDKFQKYCAALSASVCMQIVRSV